MGKSKINPKKEETKEGERELSIPEAELMAAFIGTLIAETIAAALDPLGIRLEIFLWSDSQIIHFWISKPDGHPRQFIPNRVKKIREFNQLRSASWKYVPTDQNPADILSRGASLKEFKASTLWAAGPTWLPHHKDWPTWSVDQFKTCQQLHVAEESSDLDGVPSVPLTDLSAIVDPSKYSWRILVRLSAIILRLRANLELRDRSRRSWNRQALSASELLEAELVWIRTYQRIHLHDELTYLQSKRKCWRPALVSQLDLFLDSEGIIRCGGRYGKANMTEAAKHPILIPKNSQLSKLLITSAHERIFHLGVDSTIAYMQQRYWITSYRQQVAAIVRKCVQCRRISGPAYQLPDPAPLPAARVREAYPFATMGLDYTGAISIKVKGSKELTSAYILLMTCGFSRALHLEVVPDLSTKSFLNAFRRYTGHHPLPRLIISDNASTFISASGFITNLFADAKVSRFLADRQIKWQFIPKRAPWYGGFWERLVGITKKVLGKMVGRMKVTFEELQTTVCEIEAILNDRKLTRIPSTIDDIGPLTPSHLLYGQRLTTLPYDSTLEEEMEDPSYGKSPSVLSSHYLRSQNLKKTFIRMWNKMYLPSLRSHHKKTHGPLKEIIKVGDVVQIHNEGSRDSWKLGVITNLIRSDDGQVRAADIRTANGKTNRPINKLYPLEVTETEDIVSEQKNGSKTISESIE